MSILAPICVGACVCSNSILRVLKNRGHVLNLSVCPDFTECFHTVGVQYGSVESVSTRNVRFPMSSFSLSKKKKGPVFRSLGDFFLLVYFSGEILCIPPPPLLTCQGIFGNVWRPFWLLKLEGDGAYWYLVDRVQGCC